MPSGFRFWCYSSSRWIILSFRGERWDGSWQSLAIASSLQVSWRSFLGIFSNLSSIYPAGSWEEKILQECVNPNVCGIQGLYISQLHTLSFQLLFQNFYVNLQIYMLLSGIWPRETCSTVSPPFRCPFLSLFYVNFFSLRPQHSEGFDRIH